jgi:hypothetical protein
VSSQSPEEIEAEIEVQREQLAGTLDALAAKLDVKAQAQSKVAEVTSNVKERAVTETGRPRTELLLAGAAFVAVAAALVWWRKR